MLRRTVVKVLPAAALRLRAAVPESPRDIVEAAVGVAAGGRRHRVCEAARQDDLRGGGRLRNIQAGRKMQIDDICMIVSYTRPFAASTIMTLVDAGKCSICVHRRLSAVGFLEIQLHRQLHKPRRVA